MANLQEKLEAIRVYDNVINWDTKTYLTLLDWLHPVAMKVKNKLSHMKNTSGFDYTENLTCTSLYNLIMRGCTQEPNSNGEYTDLFNAVYDGIQFINEYKNK